MLSMYPACFIKEENGYSVIFPDLNHLATCGDTFEDAMSMAITPPISIISTTNTPIMK